MNVKELMTTEVVKVQASDPVARVRRLLGEHAFHALPVVDEWGYLVGIVTCADFVNVQGEEMRRPVGEFMQRRVYTVPETVDVVLVARFMAKQRVRHLVIVRQGKVHGIISTFDMLRAIADRIVDKRDRAPDPEVELERLGLKLVDTMSSSDSGPCH